MVSDPVDIRVTIRARNPRDADERGLHDIDVQGTAVTVEEALAVFESALRAAQFALDIDELASAYDEFREHHRPGGE